VGGESVAEAVGSDARVIEVGSFQDAVQHAARDSPMEWPTADAADEEVVALGTRPARTREAEREAPRPYQPEVRPPLLGWQAWRYEMRPARGAAGTLGG
jgi:hypothetical protein